MDSHPESKMYWIEKYIIPKSRAGFFWWEARGHGPLDLPKSGPA